MDSLRHRMVSGVTGRTDYLMATFQRRQTAAGQVRIRALVRRGPRSWSRTFGGIRDARRWASELERDLDAGFAGAAPDHTLARMIDRYSRTVLESHKSGRQVARQLDVWLALLGDIPVTDITARRLSDARDRLSKTRSPATVRRYLSALSGALTHAVKDWQWLPANPVRSIFWPREPRGRVRYLADGELARLRRAAGQASADLADIVELALATGARRGELIGLTWSAVDMDNCRLLLLETKNGERRQVPLVPAAMNIMRRRKPVTARADWYVFHPQGEPGRKLDIRAAWRRALQTARLRDFRFHDLRHTAASFLAMEGATPNQIAEILGHKSLNMVKRYAHLSTENQAEALNRMAANRLDCPV